MRSSTKIVYDARWSGNYGIARYATETSSRFPQGVLNPIYSKQPPLSPAGITQWELKNLLTNSYYYSPSFTPALVNGGKQSITVHDLIHLDIQEESSVTKNIFYEKIVKKVIQKSPLTFTVSQFSKEKILEWSGVDPSKVVVTGNAASAIFSPHGDVYNMDSRYILYVGNTKAHKNIESLLNIIKLLPDEFSLLMVSPRSDDLLAQISNMGLLQRVCILEEVSESHLASIYRGAELLVMPSLYEGFGIPVLEAMASGLPVLAANTTSLTEVVGNAGVLFDPFDFDEGAKAAIKIIEDPQYKDEIISRGFQRNEVYQWDNISNIVYSNLMKINSKF